MSILDALAQASTTDCPIFKFTNPGDSIGGVIVEDPRLLPVKEFGSDNPKLDAHGQPVQQVMLVVASEQIQDAAHDGRWRVYLDKALLKQAVAAAVRESGAEDLLIGDDITITYVGKTILKNGREAKGFEVHHAPAGAAVTGTTEKAPF